MNLIYKCSWIDKNEVFCPIKHNENQLTIFQFQFTQKEGEPPFLKLYVAQDTVLAPSQKYIFFSVQKENGETQCLFYGESLMGPFQSKNNMSIITFSLNKERAHDHLKALSKNLCQSYHYHPLFVSDELKKNDYNLEALEATPHHLLWDPITHHVTLSHLTKGDKTVDLQPWILSSHLTIQEQPLGDINVEVISERANYNFQTINLAPLIASRFKDGCINTLTPINFKKRWPKTGTYLSSKETKMNPLGYQVLESSLKELPKKEVFEFQDPNSNDTYEIAHTWFKGRLVVGWQDIHQIKEIGHFKLKGNGHKKRVLRFLLQKVDCEEPSFFQTQEGVKAIAHAIDIAYTHLLYSHRCLYVSLTIPISKALELTLNDNAMTPAGLGKITTIELCQNGLQGHAKVGVAILPKDFSLRLPQHFKSPSPYQTQLGISFSMGKKDFLWDQRPIPDVIESLSVQFEGHNQKEILFNDQQPIHPMNLKNFITSFELSLKPTQQNMNVICVPITVDL